MRLLRKTASILLAPDNDLENKGGGGNDENGGFTEAQLKVLGGMLNNVVTSHMKRLPSFDEQVKSTNWAEILSPVIQAAIPKPDNDDKSKGSKTPELSEYEKQIAKLSQDMEGFKRQAQEAQQRAQAAELARKVDAGKMKLRSALTGHVQDHALDHVVNHLTLVSNRLVVDEDGTPKLKVRKPDMPGFPPTEKELPIEDAIKDVLSESDMKIFLPAPKGGGTNPGPKGTGVTSSSQFVGEAKTDDEKVARAMIREKEILEKYGNR